MRTIDITNTLNAGLNLLKSIMSNVRDILSNVKYNNISLLNILIAIMVVRIIIKFIMMQGGQESDTATNYKEIKQYTTKDGKTTYTNTRTSGRKSRNTYTTTTRN